MAGKGITRIPLNVVATATGKVTEGAVVGVLASDLNRLEADNERLRRGLRFAENRAREGTARGDSKGAASWRLGLLSIEEHVAAVLREVKG